MMWADARLTAYHIGELLFDAKYGVIYLCRYGLNVKVSPWNISNKDRDSYGNKIQLALVKFSFLKAISDSVN
jgi:hypothetical protein